jgi:hypothetical protein
VPSQDLNALRQRFLATFQKALSLESEAVRERFGPAEVPVTALTELVSGGAGHAWVYRADLSARTEKLLPDLECRLRLGSAELPVTLLTVAAAAVTFQSHTPLPPARPDPRLVVYPWFLYERLGQALAALEKVEPSSLRRAFMAFGCLPPEYHVQRLILRHDGLNRSQGMALGNCMKSSCAFVWGPPGTGKTTMLARLLLELLEHKQRVLVTSNTNAAVDQVLRALQRTHEAAAWLADGRTVRIGSPDPEWLALTPWRLAEQRAAAILARRSRLRERLHRTRTRRDASAELQRRLQAAHGPRQIDLFSGQAQTADLPHEQVAAALSPALARRLAALATAARLAFLERRLTRLDRVLNATDRALLDLHQELDDLERRLVHEARLVTATAAAVSINRFLHEEAFDTVVIEEAGMVLLPAVFLSAARAQSKVIVVGDPMQLPSIVQSQDPFVLRAMARSIFAVAAPNPFASPLVSMLEEQYRMHPTIGDIVSRVFYHGRLRHAVTAADLQHIVLAAPYAGSAVVLVDTAGHTACIAADPGPSRCNERSARAAAELARQAIGAEVQSIAVITPYTAQARTIRACLRDLGIGPERVECRTVHRFQGNERDLVILDTVDTEPFAPGVLLAGHRPGAAAANLLNVAISRARGKLIILADRAYFRRACPRAAITQIVEECAAHGTVVPLP